MVGCECEQIHYHNTYHQLNANQKPSPQKSTYTITSHPHQSLFNAFLRFSAPLAAPPVAALFIALFVPEIALVVVLLPALILASAVLRGDGDVWRSLELDGVSSELVEDEDFKG